MLNVAHYPFNHYQYNFRKLHPAPQYELRNVAIVTTGTAQKQELSRVSTALIQPYLDDSAVTQKQTHFVLAQPETWFENSHHRV